MIKTEKLNISSEIRASAIEGIHDPEMWLKEESDQRSNLVVGRNKPGNYNGRTTQVEHTGAFMKTMTLQELSLT